MPFKKGQGGRPKGARNKATVEVETACRALVDDPKYREYFAHRLGVGQLPPALEAMVWHYAYGKPTERMEVTGADGKDFMPAKVIIELHRNA